MPNGGCVQSTRFVSEPVHFTESSQNSGDPHEEYENIACVIGLEVICLHATYAEFCEKSDLQIFPQIPL